MHYLWDEFSTYGDVILESNYDYDYSRHYTLANGMLLSHSQIIANQRVPSYYLSDAQGSTRALANLSGTITDSYTYDAFGTLSEHLNLGIGGNLVPNEDGIFGTHYLYTGQQFDPYTELYSLRARYYDTSIGRFLSRDTYAYNFENPFELNRYVYTANNPVKYTDPSGYMSNGYQLTTSEVGAVGKFTLSPLAVKIGAAITITVAAMLVILLAINNLPTMLMTLQLLLMQGAIAIGGQANNIIDDAWDTIKKFIKSTPIPIPIPLDPPNRNNNDCDLGVTPADSAIIYAGMAFGYKALGTLVSSSGRSDDINIDDDGVIPNLAVAVTRSTTSEGSCKGYIAISTPEGDRFERNRGNATQNWLASYLIIKAVAAGTGYEVLVDEPTFAQPYNERHAEQTLYRQVVQVRRERITAIGISQSPCRWDNGPFPNPTCDYYFRNMPNAPVIAYVGDDGIDIFR